MSTDDLDALAESARNRGLKLVRSRVRTPGKAGFGKVGVVDAKGATIFGMDAGSPSADPVEVEDYLRGLGASDWRASLGASASSPEPSLKRRKPNRKPTRIEAPHESTPEPEPEPQTLVRAAVPKDAEALVELIGILDHAVDAAGVAERMKELANAGEPPLVATIGDEVVGLCGVHVMGVIHRPDPVGRITILAVAERARGRGLGRQLIEAAEARLGEAGCTLIEITSNDRLTRAHAFYRHLGFERTSMRFARPVSRPPSL